MPSMSPKILGTGLVALDLIVSADPGCPIQSRAGGTCGNVMSILSWLGWDAYPMARMNEDAASARVKADLQHWGVHLDLAACSPAVSTPIIVQEIRRSASGRPTHRFTWTCLRCGGWLPSFKPVTRSVVDQSAPFVPGTSVFFFDRVSRGALDVAAQAADAGAVVMFEPSGRGDEKLFREALELAHIVKYADQRMVDLAESAVSANRRLEIQTLGSAGLRFRLPRNRRNPGWRAMNAAPTGPVVDACGSGDWCTAGVLAQLTAKGVSSLEQATVPNVLSALQYGQELAAWNCAFEGARGGMYVSGPSSTAHDHVSLPVGGHVAAVASQHSVEQALVTCPKCDAATDASLVDATYATRDDTYGDAHKAWSRSLDGVHIAIIEDVEDAS